MAVVEVTVVAHPAVITKEVVEVVVALAVVAAVVVSRPWKRPSISHHTRRSRRK